MQSIAQQILAPLVPRTTPGFVPTPDAVVDLMVDKLFEGKPPSSTNTILDPGCGTGVFEEGILRWCAQRGIEPPAIHGVELDPDRHAEAAWKFRGSRSVTIHNEDFLAGTAGRRFDFVIGNPPYVAITGLSESERATYRTKYATAVGRFDLYLLFFEQALRQLNRGGRLVFITPEKFLFVKTAEPLRRMLAGLRVRQIHLVDEETFGGLVTYPTITTVDNAEAAAGTQVVLRDGSSRSITIPPDGSSLQPLLNGHTSPALSELVLEDVCLRVSCGVATGADKVYVRETASLNDSLAVFAYPTVSGRELVPSQERIKTRHSILMPYDRNGKLRPLEDLGSLGDYLTSQRRRLLARTCAARKPWHAFHDSAPLPEVLRPKLLCKDITAEPGFWFDRQGTLVPLHSVYYIVPRDPAALDALAAYLSSPIAHRWIRAHCQRAANGFLRMQSAILKKLPVPPELAPLQQERGRELPTRGLRPRHAALVRLR